MSEPSEHVGHLVTAGYQRAEQLLAAIGLPCADVTDIVISRNPDAGQRRQYTVSITAMVTG